MKTSKIYKLIFGEIIKPKGFQRKFALDDDYVFISPNGYFGFVLQKRGSPLNLEMIEDTKGKIDLQSVVKPENLLSKTNHFIMLQPHGLISIFHNNERKVYINSKYLSYFEDYAEFYQEKDLSLCVVVENGQVVGAVCPIRNTKENKQGLSFGC